MHMRCSGGLSGGQLRLVELTLPYFARSAAAARYAGR